LSKIPGILQTVGFEFVCAPPQALDDSTTFRPDLAASFTMVRS
jgi:hypothetical protein